MIIRDGYSDKTDATIAIGEITRDWPDNFNPAILFVFHSTRQDPAAVASTLDERFPDSIMVGATTAGEWIDNSHQHGTLILLAIATPEIRWSVALAQQLDKFADKDADKLCHDLLHQLNIQSSELNPKRHFCLSFFDGMSLCEEKIASMISSRLKSTPLLGGSAGDDLKFKNTYVMTAGKAYQNAAVFVLADSQLPFKAVKHQHFVLGDIDTIITKADTSSRIIYRLDGMPAAVRYAQLLGIEVADLDINVFSSHPLIYQHRHECYVRSVSHLGENNSLIFHSAIEEGMILNLCSHQDMTQHFKQTLNGITVPANKIMLTFMFNCMLRCVEAESSNVIQQHASEIAAISSHVFGFDTYGEQWNGLHINQTLVALAIFEHP